MLTSSILECQILICGGMLAWSVQKGEVGLRKREGRATIAAKGTPSNEKGVTFRLQIQQQIGCQPPSQAERLHHTEHSLLLGYSITRTLAPKAFGGMLVRNLERTTPELP